MINPSEIEVSVEEQQAWLVEHKSVTGMSWTQLSKPTGIPTGTISQFGKGNYKGDNKKLARAIFRYRQNLTQQSQLKIEAPEVPLYFETKTSKELMQLLAYAQRGRMTFFAGGPGLGKTITAREYAESVSNAWIVTAEPVMNTLNKLCMAVLRAIGDHSGKMNSATSQYLMGKLRGTAGLLIFDEAQELSLEQVEQIRSWYDQTQIGVAFLGNYRVVARMQGGSRQAEFAQLYSRVGLRLIRHVPLKDDIIALADEWRVQDNAMVAYLLFIGSKPGGLRSCTHALEIAKLVATSNGEEMTKDHLVAGWTQINSSPLAS